MRSEVGLIEVSVGERAAIWFCVDPDADDPVSDHLLEHGRFDGLADRLALDLIRPPMRVLEVGHVSGTFALPASTLGAEVVVVDTSGARLELLRRAAMRNGLTTLTLVRADQVAGSGGPHRWPSLDAVLAQVGWTGIDLIRMQTGGAEAFLLEHAQCLRGQRRPAAIVFECDAAALARVNSSVLQLHTVVTELGYELFLVDSVVPGDLVRAAPGDIQPGSRETYVALAATSASGASGWRLVPQRERDEAVRRIVENAATDEPVERTYAARLIATGPEWLCADPAIPAVVAALAMDISPVVRAATTPMTPRRESANALPAPAPAPEPDDQSRLAFSARNVSVGAPGSFDRPAGTSHPDELVLSGFSTHLRAGQFLGVLVEDEATAPELLSALARIARIADGALTTRARPILVSRLDRLVEPTLSISDNIVVLGVIFGGDVGDVMARAPDIAEHAGLRPHLERRLSEIAGVDLGRLGLATALEFAAGGLLLVGSLGRPSDPAFGRWAHDRIGELLPTGTSIVQAVRDPAHVLRQPDRLLWAAGGRVVAAGHPESVSFAFRHRGHRRAPAAGTQAADALAVL